MDDHEAPRAGVLERGDRLFRREVPAETVWAFLALLQGRLAEEEIRIAAHLGQLGARRRVTGVGEGRLAVADAERVGLQLVVRDANGRDREAVRLEGLALGVLAELERVEHACKAEPLAELARAASLPPGGSQSCGGRQLAPRAEHRAEGPRHQVAPVVEVEVRDHDRVDVGPAFLLAQARENARTAVQQDPPRALDEVPGLRAARVGPGGRATDDRQLHSLSVA